MQTARAIRLRAIFLLLLDVALATTSTNETIGDDQDFPGGNLWGGILRECKTASMSCIQKNVYRYLDDSFRHRGELKFDFLSFTKNNIDYHKYTREANEVEDDEDEEENVTPLEEVTKALQNKSMGFLMSHNTEIRLPETMFEGSTLKISPRGFEGDGVLVKLDLIPKEIKEDQAVGRILFKKIKKYFKNKLFMALTSLFLVISLIKSVLMFLVPLILGVGTAKKILLKILLFLFPALTHLFKLCAYYHDSYHGTKYHHHHHQIAHIHHVPSLHHTLPEVHYPPSGHGHGHHHGYKHEHDDFEFSGPGLGPEYISNRNAFEHTPSKSDENEIKSWGLGHSHGVQGHKTRRGHKPAPSGAPGSPITVSQIEELALHAERETMLKVRLQKEQQRIRQENIQLQEQLRQDLKLHEQLKLQAMMFAQQKTKLQPHVPQHSAHQVQHIVHQTVPQMPQLPHQVPHQMPHQMPHQTPHQVPHQTPHQMPVSQIPAPQIPHKPQVFSAKSALVPRNPVYDAFYSPILEKIDKIFDSIGIAEEACRERLVCSMYKNPVKFSPHSNLLSAELSRDPKDLQKPTSSNEAVVRFYKYVQAARDGQDQRECLRLYPTCNINTEL